MRNRESFNILIVLKICYVIRYYCNNENVNDYLFLTHQLTLYKMYEQIKR